MIQKKEDDLSCGYIPIVNRMDIIYDHVKSKNIDTLLPAM